MDNNNGKKIIASIAASLTVIIFGWLFTSIGRVNGRIDDTNDRVNELNGAVMAIEGDIKEINVNIAWIKESLGN